MANPYTLRPVTPGREIVFGLIPLFPEPATRQPQAPAKSGGLQRREVDMVTIDKLKKRVESLEKGDAPSDGDPEKKVLMDLITKRIGKPRVAAKFADLDAAGLLTVLGQLVGAGGEETEPTDPETKARHDHMDRQMGIYKTPGIRNSGTRLTLGVLTPNQARALIATRAKR
jgi:hypothetical protein